VFFAVFLVILGYRVTIYRKNLKRFIQSRTADKETSEKRLRMIEAEWPF